MSHFLAVSNRDTSRAFQAVLRCFGSWSRHRESLTRKAGPGSIDESPTHQETVPVTLTNRPSLARLFAALLLLSSLFMALLGMSASAYFVPAACLLLQAVLVWRGKGLTLFKRIIELNQITGIVLILVLWLGDALHLPKLDISGAMLLGNLLTGGPLMSVLAVPILGALLFGQGLPRWFAANAPSRSGEA